MMPGIVARVVGDLMEASLLFIVTFRRQISNNPRPSDFLSGKVSIRERTRTRGEKEPFYVRGERAQIDQLMGAFKCWIIQNRGS